MSYNELLEIDDIDKKIIQMFQDDPDVTVQQICEAIEKRDQVVQSRILKLQRKHLLIQNYGLDFKVSKVTFVRIHIYSNETLSLLDKFKNCPIIENVFTTTGKFNLCIELHAPDVKSMEKFIDDCLRKDPRIEKINTVYILDSLRPHLINLNLKMEDFIDKGCNFACQGSLSKEDVDDMVNGE